MLLSQYNIFVQNLVFEGDSCKSLRNTAFCTSMQFKICLKNNHHHFKFSLRIFKTPIFKNK